MATLLIRNLDDSVRDKLRVRAAKRGRSMEAEAREILSGAVWPEAAKPKTGAEFLAEIRAIWDDFATFLDIPAPHWDFDEQARK